MTRRRGLGCAALVLAGALVGAAAHGAGPGPVVVSGVVPDDATRQRVLARLRAVFGAEAIVDRMAVGSLAAPVGWGDAVDALVGPALRRLRAGRLEIGPDAVAVSGELERPADRDALLAALSRDGFGLREDLRLVASRSAQAALDARVAGRSVEFEPGSATLTPNGAGLLAELLPQLQRLPEHRFEIVGHTDAAGERDANLALSRARAEAVKSWLAGHGIAPQRVATRGVGPDEPVADNTSAAGRARNRRIEFRVVETRPEAAWNPPR